MIPEERAKRLRVVGNALSMLNPGFARTCHEEADAIERAESQQPAAEPPSLPVEDSFSLPPAPSLAVHRFVECFFVDNSGCAHPRCHGKRGERCHHPGCGLGAGDPVHEEGR